jgi:hypothetical protein
VTVDDKYSDKLLTITTHNFRDGIKFSNLQFLLFDFLVFLLD